MNTVLISYMYSDVVMKTSFTYFNNFLISHWFLIKFAVKKLCVNVRLFRPIFLICIFFYEGSSMMRMLIVLMPDFTYKNKDRYQNNKRPGTLALLNSPPNCVTVGISAQ